MTRKRQGAGSVATAWVCSIFANTACTHGRQAAKHSAIDVSVIDSYRSVKLAVVSRSDLSTPQYKKTTRKKLLGCLDLFRPYKGLEFSRHRRRLRRNVLQQLFKKRIWILGGHL